MNNMKMWVLVDSGTVYFDSVMNVLHGLSHAEQHKCQLRKVCSPWLSLSA